MDDQRGIGRAEIVLDENLHVRGEGAEPERPGSRGGFAPQLGRQRHAAAGDFEFRRHAPSHFRSEADTTARTWQGVPTLGQF